MYLSTAVFLGGAAAAALAAFVLYRWRMRRRRHRVEGWVRAYLADRYGQVPGGAHINCSDDTRWPVLVGFADPLTGVRHRLRFDCPGPDATFSLLSQEQDAPTSSAAPQ